MAKELLIPHSEISNSQTITQVMDRKMKEKDLSIHLNDIVDLQDDFKKGIRKLSVKNTKIFFMSNTPWKGMKIRE